MVRANENSEATLVEVVERLASLDDSVTIYAAEPWTPHSNAILARDSDEVTGPSSAESDGKYTYFLEVFIAREFLEDWIAALGREPTMMAKCERLIQYATNDA